MRVSQDFIVNNRWDFIQHQFQLVERVSWLRAKARQDRWEEEVTLVQDQMGNTVRFFEFRQQEWLARASGLPITQGHRCYAYEQADLWGALAQRAKRTFR